MQSKRVQAAELVHHKDRNPKNNDYDNLVALCVDCHAKEHGKDKAIKS
jgi:5-methylcytosine-specific restriction protein A